VSHLGRQPTDDSLGEAPRILITRLSAIGDCVQTIPLAWALRERFPQALIAWAVEAAAAPLVAAVAAVDRVIAIPKRMIASPTAAWRVRSQLQRLRLDLAIDPQSLSKSSAVGWLSGARRRIGFASPAGREVSPWLNTELVTSPHVHMVERYLDLLRPLGIQQPSKRFDLAIGPAADSVADEFVACGELARGFVAVNPGAGWDSKRWPAERFAAVIRELRRSSGLPAVILWGGQRERNWAEKISQASAGSAMLCPPTSLIELAAILKRAKLMVAGDTGPLHLAAAVGTPCVGIFGSTRREICAPYGPSNFALQAAYDGSAGRKLPGADNWAVRRVSSGAVVAACCELLARTADLATAPAVV
jgi:lipopolysaccharide heptosyltransferase I